MLRYPRSHTLRAVGVVGFTPCFAEVTVHKQALILGPLCLEAHSPNLCLSSCSFGTQAFTPCPLGGVGSQQEVDFAIDQKRELWYQWKEGASIAQKTSGERMCVQGRYYLSLFLLPPPQDRNTAQLQRGSLHTLLSQEEAVAPSNLGEGRSLVAELSGPWERWEQSDCGVLGRRLSIGWARV